MKPERPDTHDLTHKLWRLPHSHDHAVKQLVALRVFCVNGALWTIWAGSAAIIAYWLLKQLL